MTNTSWRKLNTLYLLSILFAISFILTAAMYIQYIDGLLPCPMCLLARLAFFGICFGVILSLKQGYSLRNVGLSMLSTLFLLVVSVRHTLLNISPPPNDEGWTHPPYFGFHLPVWSIIIGFILLLGTALQLIIIKQGDYLELTNLKDTPIFRKIANALIALLIFLLFVNVISTFIQCGFDMCYTDAYTLLKNHA